MALPSNQYFLPVGRGVLAVVAGSPHELFGVAGGGVPVVEGCRSC